LRDYIEGFTGENGFHFNGDYKYYGYSALHYSPFSLEAVFGFCKALQDMLLACDGGFIAPFYAVPEKWKRGEISFKDLRVHGNVALSATMFDGEIVAFSLAVPKESTMTFLNVFETDSPTFINEKGERFAFSCKRGEKFTFTAPRGNYRLEI
jgi:hypothetical protein